ncbi:MAG TPA: anthranilate/aminodeoxychorismate synthase component II, partial [Polyangiaceae bacterium]|nr:anthranilate/aminodeoxychorismate synthase component II [Polyangiaceae bacterium]
MRRVLVVDNYDSFTFNLVQYLSAQGAACTVRTNDVALSELVATEADGVLISPGPGTPEEAGVSLALI